MKSPPLVSIITTSLNYGKYLQECIESVLDQDYPRIEHIIQDGASTDNTKTILKKYSSFQYKDKIKIRSMPDNGQIEADNRALKRSKGDILLFLSADDVLLPGACSWAVKKFTEYPQFAFIYGDVRIIDSDGKLIRTLRYKPYRFSRLLCSESVPCFQSTFIQKQAFRKIGFNVDRNLKSLEDFDILVRLGSHFPAKHFKKLICSYRWHSYCKSKSSNNIPLFVMDKLYSINKFTGSSWATLETDKLHKEALVGLYRWAAASQIDANSDCKAIYYLVKSWFQKPSISYMKELIKYWKETVYSPERYYIK